MSAKKDPFETFSQWLEEATKNEPDNPTAVALATADASGAPSVRMVLLKGFDERGFVFYSNTESRKGRELAENPRAALCFHWKTLARQVRIEGAVTPVSDEEADAYYASRARDSRIGAWASKQSTAMSGRFDLEVAVAKYAAKYAIGDVPRPPFWSGYRIAAERLEFWTDKPFRLHERLIYERDGEGWRNQILFP
ncbi:MAG: pyridoxamine 5'-phosphate oxidase [Alphaproteobacteria bacterium]|jgi:pyridoxamine 5'-phosphate oxidase|nr:pyridoxamine 5'-phosphate oxidase [Alphaproteobacteria bacterium]MBT5916942.1 pyridoxamine 5'-phosphate oxidase [Alphaproteobacteria bacterium]